MGLSIWVYWVLGQVVGGGGVAVALWGLLGDRLRGGHLLRRCPGCWYSMDGIQAFACPECGRRVKKPSRFYRTRRRWWVVAGGVILLLAGTSLIATPMVRKEGWVALLPMTVQTVVWPWSDLGKSTATILRAAAKGELSNQQVLLLVQRSRAVLRGDFNQRQKTYALILLEAMKGWAASAEDELLAIMANASGGMRASAAKVVGTAGIRSERAVTELTRVLIDDPEPWFRKTALHPLINMGGATPGVVDVLGKAIKDDDHHIGTTAAEALAGMGEAGVRELGARLTDQDEEVRYRAARALGDLRDDRVAPAAEALVAALGDPHGNTWSAARNALEDVGPSVEPWLVRALDHPDDEVKYRVCGILVRRRPPLTAALPKLVELTEAADVPDRLRQSARQAVETLRWHAQWQPAGEVGSPP